MPFMIGKFGRNAFRAPAAAAVAVLCGGAAVAAEITGYWMTGTAGSVVEIIPCEGGICGRVVTLRPGGLTTDRNNKDEDKQDRPLCNLVILGGFEKTSDTTWEDGTIYDPVSGNTYAAEMSLSTADRLDLRGYVGIPLFGRTETWTRTERPADLCG